MSQHPAFRTDDNFLSLQQLYISQSLKNNSISYWLHVEANAWMSCAAETNFLYREGECFYIPACLPGVNSIQMLARHARQWLAAPQSTITRALGPKRSGSQGSKQQYNLNQQYYPTSNEVAKNPSGSISVYEHLLGQRPYILNPE